MLNLFLYKHSTLISCHIVHIIQEHRPFAIHWLLVCLAFMLYIMKTVTDWNNWLSVSPTKEGEESYPSTFFFGCLFDFKVIRLTCFQMKVRSECKCYQFVALLLHFWHCEDSKCEIAFFICFWHNSHFANLCLSVCMCAHLSMAFAPEVVFVDHSAPAASSRR